MKRRGGAVALPGERSSCTRRDGTGREAELAKEGGVALLIVGLESREPLTEERAKRVRPTGPVLRPNGRQGEGLGCGTHRAQDAGKSSGAFKEDANLEEWEEKYRESERTGKPTEDWEKYIQLWDANVGDLFLIPPGTTHGHGGNQMVIEMDTVPSVAGTAYSFFARDQGRRARWLKDNLRARPKGGPGFSSVRSDGMESVGWT
jgi:hypothetical protein